MSRISMSIQLKLSIGILPVALCAALVAAQDRSAESTRPTLKEDLAAAQRYQQEGNLEKAAAQYRAFLVDALSQLAVGRAQTGAFASAASLLEEALQLDPNSLSLRLESARVALSAGDFPRAETLSREILKDSSDAKILALAHQILGRALLKMNQDRDARKELETAVALDPTFENGYDLAVVCLDLDDEKCAVQLFSEMQASFGESAAIHMSFGRAYGNSDFAPQAVTEFKKAIAEDPRLPEAHYSLAAALLATGEDEATVLAAVTQLKKELVLSPHDFLTYAALGKIAATQHRYTEAERYLKQATSLNPKSPDAFLYLGQMYFDTDRPVDAKAMLRQAIQLTTDVSRNRYQIQKAHFLLGRILMQEHRAEEAHAEMLIARTLANKVLSKDKSELAGLLPGLSTTAESQRIPNETQATTNSNSNAADPEASRSLEAFEKPLRPAIADSYNYLGVVAASAHDYSNAFRLFKAAAVWNPSLEGLDYNLGHAAFMASRFSEAIPPLLRAVHALPHDSAIRIALAISQFMTRDFNGCIANLSDVEESLASIPQVQYVYAESLVKTGQVSSGKLRLESLEATHPEIAEVHRSLGELLDLQGDRQKAAEEVRSAIALNANEAESHYDLGKIELELEDSSAAIQELESAIRILPSEPRYHAELANAYKASMRLADAEKELHIHDGLMNSQRPSAQMAPQDAAAPER